MRYSETDKMGFVYYGYYSFYYEVGRTEAIRSLGISYKELEEQDVLLPVLEMKAKYVLPARYDDLLTVLTTLHELPSRKIVFHTEIQNAQGDTINYGETTLVFLDKKSQKVIRAPKQLLAALKAHFTS